MSFRKVYNFASVYTHSTLCFSASPQCLWKSERLMFVIFYAVIKRWFHVKVGVDIVSLMWIWFSVLCCLRTRLREAQPGTGVWAHAIHCRNTPRESGGGSRGEAEPEQHALQAGARFSLNLWEVLEQECGGKPFVPLLVLGCRLLRWGCGRAWWNVTSRVWLWLLSAVGLSSKKRLWLLAAEVWVHQPGKVWSGKASFASTTDGP